MKGYKALHWDMSARPSLDGEGRKKFGCFKYKTGGSYSMDGRPVVCKSGFHFCHSVSEVYVWYPSHFDTRVCEVDTGDDAIVRKNTYKLVTNRITIVRELTPREIMDKMIEEDIWWRDKTSIYVYSTICTSGLEESIRFFRQNPGTYVLWNGVTGCVRCPRPRDLPKLEKRADEWLAVLNVTEQEKKE